MNSPLSVEWHCTHCRWGVVERRAYVIARLRALGMLTRDEPDDTTLWELARAGAPRLKCPDCRGVGLRLELARDDAESWGDPVPCEACGAMIPRERLEVLPDSRLCASCQGKLDRGATAGPSEYCPRCGAPMLVRPSRGAGITRYAAVCSQGARCGR